MATYLKIDKRQARRLWAEHQSFIIVGCNLQPRFGIEMRPSWQKEFNSFDHMINNFTYYNCDAERGRYPAFYLLED